MKTLQVFKEHSTYPDKFNPDDTAISYNTIQDYFGEIYLIYYNILSSILFLNIILLRYMLKTNIFIIAYLFVHFEIS